MHNSNDRDRDLWTQFQEGNMEAFDRLYVSYAPLLYNYGVHLIPNKEYIKDCLHDFFVYLWEKRERLGTIRSIKGYLFIAFKRRLAEERSKRKVRLLPISAEFFLDPIHSPEDGLIAYETENDRLAKLKAAFQHLSPRQKEALFLRFHENLSYDQIAVILNFKDTKYARTLIYRSINHLKETLREKSTGVMPQVGDGIWWLSLLTLLLP